MISYTLKCGNGHSFDSWFQSGNAFDKLKAAGMVCCTLCDSTDVEKAIMAPRVRPAREAAVAPVENTAPEPEKPLTTPASPGEQAIAEFKARVEAGSEYVGKEFASQARAIHEGELPDKPIYGEARPEEAKKLLEDGIPVAPLPFMPTRKTN
jgi:hypothetical protein